MTADPSLTAHDLLRHEPFVRAVARALVRDKHAVDDLVQDTWLRALRRPRTGLRSARAWLGSITRNLARDRGRDDAPRDERERDRAVDATDARATESAAASFERLAAQRELVDAVLALDEPYRAVVLLRYADDLSTAAIAERTGRSEATVRSQLSRAHALLRERLDRSFDGGRAAWAALLVPGGMAAPDGTTAVALGTATATGPSAPWMILGLVVVGGAATFLAINGLPRSTATVPRLTEGPSSAPVDPTPTAPALAGSSGSERRALAAAQVADDGPSDAALEQLDVLALRTLAHQTQRRLEELLLEPDASLVEAHRAFLEPDSGERRGLMRMLDGSLPQNTLNAIGNGTYFSFHTLGHDENDRPSLTFEERRLESRRAGWNWAIVVPLGVVDLERLTPNDRSVPTWLDPDEHELWELAWADRAWEEAEHSSPFKQRLRSLRETRSDNMRPPVRRVGEAFLVRTVQQFTEDRVVAMRCLALDEYGATFAWRELEQRPRPGTSGGASTRPEPRFEDTPPAPAWMAALGVEDLIAFLDRVRRVARPKLFEVDDAVRARFDEIVADDGASFAKRYGFTRLLHREQWRALVEEVNEGPFYSFLNRSHSLRDRTEIVLQPGPGLSPGAQGPRRSGLILDLGEVPFAELAVVMGGAPPSTADERLRETYAFLRDVCGGPIEGPRRERSLDEADAARIDELELDRTVPAILGHTYAMRTLLYDTHDHLVVFTLVDEDPSGFSLAWRIAESRPVPR